MTIATMWFRNELLLFVIVVVGQGYCLNDEADRWYSLAQETLQRRLHHVSPLSAPLDVARNVIVFVGDGMSLATLTAARVLKGQRTGLQGEDGTLAWDEFPAVALAKTYNADAQVGESSACATALWCGVKANYETVGLDSSAKFGNCVSSFNSRVPSVFTWAQEQGKTTGIVTTTRISHATPAGLYAHSPSRYWEDDSKAPPLTRRRCKDIVRQLVEDEPGRNINVLLGGGRRHWFSMATKDPQNPDKEGRRLDGRNLITEWIRNKKDNQLEAEYVWNKEQLDQIDASKIDHLLGLFAYSHMDFDTDRDNKTQPSLAEMTRVALKILQKNPWGYFLVVEGGRIDHAHHYNNAFRALDETLAFEEAVSRTLQEVDLQETLVIVTADHGHVMTFGGHGTQKGNPIFEYDSKTSDISDQPYTTLLYGNGPGHRIPQHEGPISDKNVVQASAVPRMWATHGGEDVPVFAVGPLASLFSGIFDQSFLPHAISYVSCIGRYKNRCDCLYFGCEELHVNETNDVEFKNDVEVMNLGEQIAEHLQLISYVNCGCENYVSLLNIVVLFLIKYFLCLYFIFSRKLSLNFSGAIFQPITLALF